MDGRLAYEEAKRLRDCGCGGLQDVIEGYEGEMGKEPNRDQRRCLALY